MGKYVLSNFATVEEVLNDLDNYQIYNPPLKLMVKRVTFLFIIWLKIKQETALIEYINCKLTVHHNVKAISNEPSYDQQQKILKQAKELGFYNVDKLPGGANSAYRFVRITFISENIPEAKSMD